MENKENLMKHCKKCNTLKSINEFHIIRKTKLKYMCKSCIKLKNKRYYDDNKEVWKTKYNFHPLLIIPHKKVRNLIDRSFDINL